MDTDLTNLQNDLEELERRMTDAELGLLTVIDQLPPGQQLSARNLIHYLALRNEDIRDLQDRLHIAGLSSLASSESHILRQLQTILKRLNPDTRRDRLSECDFTTGKQILKKRAETLFGSKVASEMPRIMVTFDTGFADDVSKIEDLLRGGMGVARINCAHDNRSTWEKMITLIKKAEKSTGLTCKIYMDLAGPKIRTQILGKGRRKGRVRLLKGKSVIFAENDAQFDKSKKVIGCSEVGLTAQLKKGDKILFDDGLIEAVVTERLKDQVKLKIVRNSEKKLQLKAKKGMNFPDSDLVVSSLTTVDRSILPFICQHADLLGYSFVRDADDVARMQEILAQYPNAPRLILKIETPQAVKHFPSLLIQGMKDEVFGVMIARGDLAVEIGFERMSEIQEEIIWICESAHVPVIWATQVLETLNKSGIATRSEITDASYAAMAECVMINKGDYVMEVLKTLRDVMQRTATHHVKKRYTFRPMQIAIRFFTEAAETHA